MVSTSASYPALSNQPNDPPTGGPARMVSGANVLHFDPDNASQGTERGRALGEPIPVKYGAGHSFSPTPTGPLSSVARPSRPRENSWYSCGSRGGGNEFLLLAPR